MRDFLPADVRKREYVIGVIKQVYESYGFEPLETPAVENLETLTGKYGEEGNQLIYKILKRGEKLEESLVNRDIRAGADGFDATDSGLADLALRYDLTVPLARVVANNKNELPKFFKRYQIQPVWRADRPARGRFREFYQCDVDAIGSDSMVVEAELISAVSEILTRLNFDDFVIKVNHRDYLFGVLEYAGVPENQRTEVLITMDKLDKIGSAGIRVELDAKNIKDEIITKVMAFVDLTVSHPSYIKGAIDATVANPNQSLEDNEDLLARQNEAYTKGWIDGSADLLQHSPMAKHGVEQFNKTYDYLRGNPAFGHVRFEPSLARGLSYYTGTIMEINVDGIGSLGGGGRYDGLIGMFGKEQIPACGFSLGLERILVVMEERGMFPPEISDSTLADVMVTIFNEETVADSLKLAAELRSQNLRVTVYPEADKLGKQLKYADSIRVPYVCVLGESEIADGKVTLKNMKTGEQKTIDRNGVAANVLS